MLGADSGSDHVQSRHSETRCNNNCIETHWLEPDGRDNVGDVNIVFAEKNPVR